MVVNSGGALECGAKFNSGSQRHSSRQYISNGEACNFPIMTSFFRRGVSFRIPFNTFRHHFLTDHLLPLHCCLRRHLRAGAGIRTLQPGPKLHRGTATGLVKPSSAMPMRVNLLRDSLERPSSLAVVRPRCNTVIQLAALLCGLPWALRTGRASCMDPDLTSEATTIPLRSPG
jgi:hypothetical protein